MFTKAVFAFVQSSRTLSTSQSCLSRANNHYDVLGITPKATQRDIKSAYYKLSKVYHPDKSNDEESGKKFRAITEAYEVLGNINLKKMYDKGLFVGRENAGRMEYKPEPEPIDPTLKFYKSRTRKNYAATIDGTTPVYNFDAWSRNHYAHVFQKSQYAKNITKTKRDRHADRTASDRQEFVIYSLIALGGLFVLLVSYGKDNYDVIKETRKKDA